MPACVVRCARVGACMCVLCLSLYIRLSVCRCELHGRGREKETGLGRAPQLRSSSGDGRGCCVVAGIGTVMTNALQSTGDGLWPSSSLLLSLLSSISPERERLRGLRVLQKQVARPQEAVGQPSPYYFIPGEGD